MGLMYVAEINHFLGFYIVELFNSYMLKHLR